MSGFEYLDSLTGINGTFGVSALDVNVEYGTGK
jgi:hypothetical protein